MKNVTWSVSDVVEKILNSEIEAGRVKLENLLKPKRFGECNDFAMIIQAIASHSNLTGSTVREETVLRYIRAYKARKRRQVEQDKALQASQNATPENQF